MSTTNETSQGLINPVDVSFKKSGSRIPELDGVRGVAILLVVCFHFFEIPQSGGGWVAKFSDALLSMGWSGVDLFFVLSGFLIGGILIDNRDSASYFRTFYLRRVCRIFPLYFLWLALYYLLGWLLRPGFPGYSGCFGWEIPHFPKWGYIFFLQNFYVSTSGDFGPSWMAATWSLAIEEQFYLIMPAVIFFAFRRKPVRILVVLIALVPVLRIFLFLFHSSLFIYVLSPCRADALLIGVMCACLLRQKRACSWLVENTKILYGALFCLLAGMGYFVFLAYGHGAKRVFDSFDMVSLGFTVVALFYACVLLIAVIARTGVIAGFLRIPLLRHFGMVAYGMYIIHRTMHLVTRDLVFGVGADGATTFSRNIAAIVAFLATWFVALLSWHFFERPIIQWGHTFRYARTRMAGSRNAVALTPDK